MYLVFFEVYSHRGRKHSEDDFFSAAETMMWSSSYIVLATALFLLICRGPGLFFRKPVGMSSRVFMISEKRVRLVCMSILILCTLFSLLYGINGGFGKLFLLGSDLDSREYRFLNFNEVSRKYTYMLQIARRILLPGAIFFLVFLVRLKVKSLRLMLLYAICLQLLASAMTFDRAPFAMLMVAVILAFYLSERSKVRQFLYLSSGVFLLAFVGGLVTKLQYNILDFDVFDVLVTGFDFIVSRTLLVPSIIPINLSFAMFDGWGDNLQLSGSRLFGIFSGNVIGTAQDNSLLVAPVGFVGDIWRNFGVLGILLSPAFFVLLFRWLDKRHRRSTPAKKILGSYLVVGLVFYWIMGVVFSAGAFLVLITVLFIYLPKIRLFPTKQSMPFRKPVTSCE